MISFNKDEFGMVRLVSFTADNSRPSDGGGVGGGVGISIPTANDET